MLVLKNDSWGNVLLLSFPLNGIRHITFKSSVSHFQIFAMTSSLSSRTGTGLFQDYCIHLLSSTNMPFSFLLPKFTLSSHDWSWLWNSTFRFPVTLKLHIYVSSFCGVSVRWVSVAERHCGHHCVDVKMEERNRLWSWFQVNLLETALVSSVVQTTAVAAGWREIRFHVVRRLQMRDNSYRTRPILAKRK